MPMDTKRYPSEWKKIATEKKESVGWKCEVCGKQCRRPGEKFDTHKRTLTVAHLNHTPEDVRPRELRSKRYSEWWGQVICAKTKEELVTKLRETIADLQQLLERLEGSE